MNIQISTKYNKVKPFQFGILIKQLNTNKENKHLHLSGNKHYLINTCVWKYLYANKHLYMYTYTYVFLNGLDTKHSNVL